MGVSFPAFRKTASPEPLAIEGVPGSLFFFAGSTLRNVYGLITYSISTLGSSISVELGRKRKNDYAGSTDDEPFLNAKFLRQRPGNNQP